MRFEIVKNVLGAKQVRYECPKCGTTLKNSLSQAGEKDACPECRVVFVVPGQAEKQQDQLIADQLAEDKRQRAENRKAQKIEAKRQAAAQAPTSQPVTPMAKPYRVQTDPKPARTRSRSNTVILGFDVLQFAIDTTKSVIAALFLLVLLGCSLVAITAIVSGLWIAVREIAASPEDRIGFTALLPSLILFLSAIGYAIGTTISVGTISVLFKIEENTRP